MKAYGPLAGWYDELTEDIPYAEFADFFERAFAERGRRSIRTVLDLACGTGSLTLELARRGYETIAVDSSPDMLSRLAEKAGGLQNAVPPLLLCQELRELDLFGTVDAAVCSLDGINYLPPGDLPELFRRLHLFIEPDGLLLFDLNLPERLRSLDGQLFADEAEGLFCVWRAEFSAVERCLRYGMDIFSREKGSLWRREQEEHTEYAHEPEELFRLLLNAGFSSPALLRGPQSGEGRVFIAADNTPH